MVTHFTGPVAAIRGKSGAAIGAGCLVLGRFVVTCAHVVADAVGADGMGATAPEATLTFDLPFLGRRGLAAKVVAWYPVRPLADLVDNPLADVAVLALEGGVEVPGGLGPEDIDRRPPVPKARFVAYGFPEGWSGSGTQADGEVLVAGPGGWLQLRDTQSHGFFIKPGFSGGPVFSVPVAGTVGDRPRLIGLSAQAEGDETVRLALALPAHQLCVAWPLLARPYLGLFAFGEEEADLFFGREAFVGELETKLDAHSFTVVVGPSGAGKSSAVLAGLVPRLRKKDWQVAACRPLRNPLRELALGLVPLLDPGAVSLAAREKLADDWVARLTEDPGRILDLGRSLSTGGGRTLLVIDQFEELFTMDAAAPDGGVARKEAVTREDGSPRQAAFLKVLEAIGRQDPRRAAIRAVATLRADFMGAALEIGRLAGLLREADVKLGPMTAAELSDAIRKPAEQFGVSFEPGLAEEMVADMKGRPGGLPLLQFALDRLWQRQADRRLSLAAYRGARGKGGLETALNDHAEAVLAELGRDRELGPDVAGRVRRVMLRLVRLGDGEGTPDAREVIRRRELRAEDWPLVERLADARLVMIGRTESGEETAEVAHEALIGAWDRLKGWLEADRAFGLWRQRLESDLERYAVTPEDALLRGGVLAEALGWLASHRDQLTDPERAFVEASEARAKREADQKLKDAEERAALAAENQRRAEEEKRLSDDLASGAQQREEMANSLVEQERVARLKQKRLNNRLRSAVALLLMLLIGIGYLYLDNRAKRVAADEAADRADSAAAAGALARANAEAAAKEQARERAKADAAAARAETEAARALAAAREAKGRQLAAEALAIQRDQSGPGDATQAAALAIEAWRRAPTESAFDAAAVALRGLPIASIDHGSPVNAVAFSPDGTLLATGSEDGSARLIRTADGSEVMRVAHAARVNTVAFSRDSSLLATASSDGSARLIKTKDGGEVMRVAYDVVVDSVALSPDGILVAIASRDGIARLVNLKGGNEVARIHHDGWVTAVAFSPDGTLLATASSDGSARLTRTTDGSQISRFEHNDAVYAVAFSPDGTLLATASADGSARLIRIRDGKRVANVEHDDSVLAVAFSPDGTLLATGSGDGTARLVRTVDGSEVARIEHDDGINAVAFSRNSTLLATGSEDGSARLFRTNDGSEAARTESDAAVRALAFSPDGALFATASDDGSARLFSTKHGGNVVHVEHDGAVHTVAFSADGIMLATGSGEGAYGSAGLFRAKDGTEVARIQQDGEVHAIAFSADGSLLVTGDVGGSVRLIRTEDGGEVARMEEGAWVSAVAFSPDGTLLAIGCKFGGSARLIRTQDGSEIARIDGANVVAFSPDGTLLATGSDDGGVRLTSTKDGGEAARTEFGAQVDAVTFSPDGTLLAIAGTRNRTWLIRTMDGSEVASIEHDSFVKSVAFSPDGTLLATGSYNGSVRLIHIKDGREVSRIEHDDSVNSVVFTSDGTLLATASDDGSVRLIKTEDGSEIARLREDGSINAVAFSPDGTLLATGSNDGSAGIWLTPNTLFAKLCAERVGRNLTAEEWIRHIGPVEDWAPTCPKWPSNPDLIADWQVRQSHAENR